MTDTKKNSKDLKFPYVVSNSCMLFSIKNNAEKPKCESTIENEWQHFPGGTAVKNPPANAGDTGSIPGPGRSHMPRSN